jgi:4-amino-4-deoxy-L-arabinose transferase-like glycosyltransferase
MAKWLPAQVARVLASSRVIRLAVAATPVALLAVAAVLRCVNLGNRQLFRDEAASWLLSSYPLGTLLDHARFEAYPPLYSIALSGWTGLFGDGEAAMRTLSVLAGLVTLAVVWAWAREALGRSSACVALALAGLSVLLIDDARDARMYAIETAFTTTSWWLTWRLVTLGSPERAIRRGTVLTATVLAIAVAGELWTLALGLPSAALQMAFACVGAVAAVGAVRGRRTTERDSARPGAIVGAIAIGAATFLLWLPMLLAVAGNGQPFWTARPGLDAIGQTFDRAFSVTGHWDVTMPARLIAILLAVVGVVGLLSVRRKRGGDSEPRPGDSALRPRTTGTSARDDHADASRRWRLRWFGIALLFAVGLVPVVWLYSQLRPIYDPRYMGAVAPPLCLLIAAGLPTLARWLHSRVVPSILLAILVTTMASGALDFVRSRSVGSDLDPAQETVAQLIAVVRPGDVVLTNDARTYFPIDYYIHRAGGEQAFGIEVYDWCGSSQPFFYGTYLISQERVVCPALIGRVGWARALPGLRPGGSIWLVTISSGTRDEIGFAPLNQGQLVQQSRLLVTAAGGLSGRVGQIRELQIPGP